MVKGVDVKELEILKKYFCDHKISLAVAESITCGNLQALIGSISGASDFFKGGITAYNLGQKVKHLNIEELHAKPVDCVSGQVAIEMARGVTVLFNSTIGLGTTGFAELKKGVPNAYIAVFDARTNDHKVIQVEKRLQRVEMQKFTADSALHLLINFLKCQPKGSQ